MLREGCARCATAKEKVPLPGHVRCNLQYCACQGLCQRIHIFNSHENWPLFLELCRFSPPAVDPYRSCSIQSRLQTCMGENCSNGPFPPDPPFFAARSGISQTAPYGSLKMIFKKTCPSSGLNALQQRQQCRVMGIILNAEHVKNAPYGEACLETLAMA